ncbi:twin-arginine translocase TatA/TatE family subunit [Candidatus Thioglobus sp.]|uniref:twin-arginine translocase TatA/TatE family subunit n=1 Tax=Candidatus Thioglobus sp. TaxID=2026721 RepID=UPI00262FB557|nr:twin-arginine translocase TatA/TatE family subunit [Candidatus Thioglobus sp.]MDG2395425.1 twin-arginine translocase TatA/TatE family subunit [Candidatus Thioglobus sp.]
MMPGPFELIIILVIVLVLFGGKRLKNIGGDLGNAIKGFKKSMKDGENNKLDDKDEIIEAKVVDDNKDKATDKK